MGGSSSDHIARPEEWKGAYDCKFYAEHCHRLLDENLTIVRGYAVTDEGFTEHWWCEQKARAWGLPPLQVDVTAFAHLKGIKRIKLIERKEALVSLCDAYDGPCRQRPNCEWCEIRLKLELSGLHRAPVSLLASRAIVSRLFDENKALRTALERATQALDRERNPPRPMTDGERYAHLRSMRGR